MSLPESTSRSGEKCHFLDEIVGKCARGSRLVSPDVTGTGFSPAANGTNGRASKKKIRPLKATGEYPAGQVCRNFIARSRPLAAPPAGTLALTARGPVVDFRTDRRERRKGYKLGKNLPFLTSQGGAKEPRSIRPESAWMGSVTRIRGRFREGRHARRFNGSSSMPRGSDMSAIPGGEEMCAVLAQRLQPLKK